MTLIGLTGGIASGKSTVARLLEGKGATIIDADRIGHDVLAPGGPAYHAVIERFGDSVRSPDGTIDRSKLGDMVFADRAARADLEAISHPAIFVEIMRRIDEKRDSDAVVVLDAALLVESFNSTGTLGLDALVVVASFPEEQLERMMGIRGMSEEDARARMAAQSSTEKKLAMADIVVNNRGTLEQLEASVETLWSEISNLKAPP